MISADAIRHSTRQAHRWRDRLWQAITEDLEQRNPAAARAAHRAIETQQVHLLVGHATQSAVLAWPYLDVQARRDWIWVCQYVQQTWLRGYLAVATSDLDTSE